MNGTTRWSLERANEWYAQQPWLVGCNFIPSSAINQLEMWQADTFDPPTIERELAWAASIGFNTVRTFLHDLAWGADPQGLLERVDCFLQIASSHGIRPMLVIFDDCWNPNPATGSQPAPKPGIHNSGWLQSPGLGTVNCGPSVWGRLERYVTEIVKSFSKDQRILLWDLYNEPGNSDNMEKSLPLLKSVFEWARAVNPSQPLTAGIWSDNQALTEFKLAASDIITFHDYFRVEHLERQISELKVYGRPLICTEWMARTRGSLVSTHLPIFARENIGCINWGLVAGKTNTMFGWGAAPEDPIPDVWFHDLFSTDGSPHDPAEIELFKQYTQQGSARSSAQYSALPAPQPAD